MLEEMVRAVVRKVIAREYPHLKQPAILYAEVATAARQGEWNEYTLRMLRRFGGEDGSFPAIPGIRSRARYEVGAVVAVALAYGDTPVILGEVQL